MKQLSSGGLGEDQLGHDYISRTADLFLQACKHDDVLRGSSRMVVAPSPSPLRTGITSTSRSAASFLQALQQEPVLRGNSASRTVSPLDPFLYRPSRGMLRYEEAVPVPPLELGAAPRPLLIAQNPPKVFQTEPALELRKVVVLVDTPPPSNWEK